MIGKKSQSEIIREIAKEQGLSYAQAEEVWALFVNKIQVTISENKMENGQYVFENFKSIHIDNFGKFTPRPKAIEHANKCLREKQNKDD